VAASREAILETITRYVDYLTQSADQVVPLFAEGATVEDPVGTEVRTTRESIREFFAGAEAPNKVTKLGIVRIAGGQAAFSFELSFETNGKRYSLTPIDVMTFDESGLITSLRAFWGSGDIVRS